MDLAEERGLGLRSMKIRAEAAKLPLPKYAWEDPYLVLTLYRSSIAAVKALGGEVSDELTNAERLGWEWLATKDTITTAQYESSLNLPNRTAKNHLKKFTELGLLKMVGAGRATRYVVTR
jgi:ATP-dependent DNA helicase RecG